VLVQLRQKFKEIRLKQVDSQLDVLNVASEELEEERLVDEVSEANESVGLLAVDENRPRDEAHVLDVAHVRPVHQKGQDQVQKRLFLLAELLAI